MIRFISANCWQHVASIKKKKQSFALLNVGALRIDVDRYVYVEMDSIS